MLLQEEQCRVMRTTFPLGTQGMEVGNSEKGTCCPHPEGVGSILLWKVAIYPSDCMELQLRQHTHHCENLKSYTKSKQLETVSHTEYKIRSLIWQTPELMSKFSKNTYNTCTKQVRWTYFPDACCIIMRGVISSLGLNPEHARYEIYFFIFDLKIGVDKYNI